MNTAPVSAPAPAPLPADLDILPRRDLVALAEQRGVQLARRADADDIRWTLRRAHRSAEYLHKQGQVRMVQVEWSAHRPPVTSSAATQVLHRSLSGLTSLFSHVGSEGDQLLATMQFAVPLLHGFVNGDARVGHDDAVHAVGMLVQAMDRARQNREEAASRAVELMGDTQTLLAALTNRTDASGA